MRPPFPSVIDSTLMSHFRACGRKAYLESFEHWKPRTHSVHLHAGAAFARGLEVAREQFYGAGLPERDAIAGGMKALVESYGAFECPPDSAKSLERMMGAFEFYFSEYPMSSDSAKPATLPGGGLGVEFNFAQPMDIKHPETGDPLVYCGRFDMICDYAGALYGEDDKTTSQLGASWSRTWDLRSQFTAYCLSGETEVLTPQGWVEIQRLQKDTPVMDWSPEGMKFSTPIEYFDPEYNGSLIEFDGKVSFSATPDHKTVVFDEYSKTYKTFLLKDLPRNSGTLRFISAGLKLDGDTLDDDLARLLVAVQADGSWLRKADGTISGCRFHFDKERKFLRLEALLSATGLQRTYWQTENFSIRLHDCEELQAIAALLGDKKLWGSWLLGLTHETLRVIIEELRYWDGTVNDTLYSTSILENAEWLRTAMALCGYRGSIHQQDGWKTNFKQTRLFYTKTVKHAVHLHKENTHKHQGKVYCLKMSSGFFLIRHRGRISVTGNCWGARELGIPIQGFIVRGVSILKTKYETQQAITYRPAWMVERWYEQTLRDLQRMIQSWESGEWDYNLDESCNSYGGCPYRKICLTTPETAVQWLRTDFERRAWDPLTRTETLLEA